jgi:LytS/YehU family sensor histidine kinase
MQERAYTLRSLTLFVSSHFMFNVLGKLQSEILGGQKREAISTLTLYSRLIRQACSIAHFEKISLEEESLFLDNYLKLEKERFAETPFTYEILGFDATDFFIAPFLLQAWVELAVLGSLGVENNQLLIEFKHESKEIWITSTMIHKDVNEKLAEKLKEVKERLTFFNHTYQLLETENRILQKIKL